MPPQSEQMVNWNTFKSGLLMRWIWGAGRCEFPFNLQHRRITGPDSLGSYTLPNTPLRYGSKWKMKDFFKSHNKTAFRNKCVSVSLFCVSSVRSATSEKAVCFTLAIKFSLNQTVSHYLCIKSWIIHYSFEQNVYESNFWIAHLFIYSSKVLPAHVPHLICV